MTDFLASVPIGAVLKAFFRVPAITAYNRLEPRPRTLDFTRSLRAEVRDGLWFLTRQWQLGELQAEDAASPIEARLVARSMSFDRVSLAGGAPQELDDDVPLDVVVEREAFPWSLTMRVEAAELFMSHVPAAARVATRLAARSEFPLQPEADWAREPDTTTLLRLAVRRSFDGGRLVASHQNGTLATDLGVPAADVDPAGDALLAWGRRMYGPSFAPDDVPPPPPGWLPDRLAYDISLATPETVTGDAATLIAPRYAGGRLDWEDFDAAPASLELDPLGGAVAPDPDPDPVSFLPVAASFPGMPNPRFWEMEDRRINFGSLNAKTTDHLLLTFAEMGLVYGNDWFVVPMDLPVGRVHEVTGLVVTDVFGDRTLVPAANDPVELTWQRWSMFSMTGESRDAWSGRVFWLPATLTYVDESPPLEEVVFARDEMANLVWGVETVVPGGTGSGTETASLLPAAAPEPATTSTRYRLGTSVPENWVPFLPEHLPGSISDIRFRRGAMPPLGDPPVEPRRRGVLLRELPAPFYLAEEEVPGSGVRVTRRVRRTRWHDGRTFLWIGRERSTGRGAASSGLAFDQILEPPPA